MKKFTLHSEIAYFLGIIFLAIGNSLIERANFGMSMVIAPAYILHLKISNYLPFFTFGTASYVLQFFLLIIMCLLIKKVKIAYLFSFVTAIISGYALDGAIYLFSLVPITTIVARIICFVVGIPIVSLGVALLFKTYLSPEAYDLFVKEVSLKFNISIGKFKTIYDVSSCVLSIILSFAFFGFGNFSAINVGTVICAFVNGFVISFMSRLLEKCFNFNDLLPLRKYF